jgi:hypothetical protein
MTAVDEKVCDAALFTRAIDRGFDDFGREVKEGQTVAGTIAVQTDL